MFNTLQTYVVIGLVVLLMAVSSTFYFVNRSNTARIESLVIESATYSNAVEVQKKTIQELVADAERQVAANNALAERMMLTEREFVDEWSAINALDLSSAEALANTDELERKVNAEFSRSIENLRTASGGGSVTDPDGVRK